MRITDRSPQGRRLQTIFFPAEPKPVMPSEVSDEIVLIHPAVPPMVGFKESQFFFQEALGVVGAIEVEGPLVPTDRYWWIQFCELQHNDGATQHNLRLAVRDTVPNTVVVFNTEGTRDVIPVGVDRPIILPNDTRLVAQVPAIAAGSRVRIRFYFYELLHAEVNPSA